MTEPIPSFCPNKFKVTGNGWCRKEFKIKRNHQLSFYYQYCVRASERLRWTCPYLRTKKEKKEPEVRDETSAYLRKVLIG